MNLLLYVRFPHNGDVIENILMCKPIEDFTTGEAIFNTIDNFFKLHDIDWATCKSVCTDGAASMTGKNKGLVARIRAINPSVQWTHCIIHREALVAKQLSESLNNVLMQCVRIINVIKASPLKSRLFCQLCEDSGADYKQLLLHTEVRWLSRGRALSRLFQLRDEVYQFLFTKLPEMASHFDSATWLLQLGYLVDIICKLNEFNLSLQGNNACIPVLLEKAAAFVTKIRFWRTQVDESNFCSFSNFSLAADAHPTEINTVKDVILHHLDGLTSQFEKYFPGLHDSRGKYVWVLNLFIVTDFSTTGLSSNDNESLIELQSSEELKVKHRSTPLTKFWSEVKTEFCSLATVALDILLPFGSTYLCEATFSVLCEMKTKKRNRLDVENDLIVAVSGVAPRISKLCANKSAHPSH